MQTTLSRDDIIRMAREAATEDGSVKRKDGKNVVIYAAKTNRFLERFAALVAAAERDRLLSASELCRVCEQRRIRHETTTQNEANS